ncbi:NADP-specific glutamate dehydrogenase [Heracleum sosnowskyi]|uniref:NADP-specific glutamate dehydrogenase n=1 Tax=Heracleum sosnowskyi TaxID=360622 RepID=A0AAD8IC06_9APIA|nr:NADP-specific glutamate dehydrogenase [Heracleum sosnowskyi]
MCRGFQQSESERFLKMKAFNLVFSLANKSCVTTFPDSLTLHYLPRINGTHLEINHSMIKPDSPAFLTLHRVVSPLSDNYSVCFASREKVKASQGARFEVFFGDVRVLKGFFRKDWDDTWKMECSCGLECSSAGRILQEIVKKSEVSVVAEGGVVMNETVEIVAKRRQRRLLKGGTLEEIPEETEYCYDFADDESCSSGCSCCEEFGESESESCGDQEIAAAAEAEEEMEGEGSWAVDVGIWVLCLGVGLLVSRASSKRLLRRRTAFL